MPEVIFGQPLSRSEAILQNMLGANNVLEPPMSREEYLLLQLLDHIGPSGDYYTKEEIDNMISAIEQEIDWKESVATFADLATTYPDAEAGWTSTVLDVGRIYRYNGTDWIDIYGMIPLATSSVNGLMSTGKVIDLETVKTLLSGHSVASDVPSNAVFTDTVYDDTALSGRVTAVEGLLDSHSVASDVPADAVFTDTVYDDTALASRVSANEEDIDDLQEWTSSSTKTVTGNPITINDGSALPAKSLSMSIEPQQDLHGYDKPWAGGAGKNKLPMTVANIKALNTDGAWTGNSYVLNGVTFDLLTDADENIIGITANGENTGRGRASLYLCNVQTLNSLLDGSYVFSGCPNDGSSSTYRMFIGSSSFDAGNGVNFTTPIEGNKCGISIYQGYNAQNLTFYPMIRLATETDATFEPYSNICSPTGYDDCEVEVTGKNKLQNTASTNTVDGVTYTVNSDGRVVASGTANGTAVLQICSKIPIDVSWGTVTLSGLENTTNLIWNSVILYDDSDTVVERIVTTGSGQNKYNKTFNLADYPTASKISVSIKRLSDGAVSGTIYPQLEKGSTSTPYEPYQSHTATITFVDTVYGGQVDFETGRVRMTKEIKDMGDLDWYYASNTFYANFSEKKDGRTNFITSAYKVVDAHFTDMPDFTASGTLDGSDINFKNSNYTDTTLFKTAMTGQTVCYELATPTELTLTPTQLELLKGNNTITANGATITLEYLPDTLLSDAEIESRKYTDEKITTVLPTAPSTDGTYVLTCTVADGEATLSWEAQS